MNRKPTRLEQINLAKAEGLRLEKVQRDRRQAFLGRCFRFVVVAAVGIGIILVILWGVR